MKVVMGPEALVLDYKEYPITFAALSAIKDYNTACEKADTDYSKKVSEANSALLKIKAEALSKLKGSLR